MQKIFGGNSLVEDPGKEYFKIIEVMLFTEMAQMSKIPQSRSEALKWGN